MALAAPVETPQRQQVADRVIEPAKMPADVGLKDVMRLDRASLGRRLADLDLDW